MKQSFIISVGGLGMGGLEEWVDGWTRGMGGRVDSLMGVGMKTYITSLRLGEVASSLQVLTTAPPARRRNHIGFFFMYKL